MVLVQGNVNGGNSVESWANCQLSFVTAIIKCKNIQKIRKIAFVFSSHLIIFENLALAKLTRRGSS